MMGIKQLQHCYGLVLLWAVLAITMIKPPYPELLYLQHIPTVAALLCLTLYTAPLGIFICR